MTSEVRSKKFYLLEEEVFLSFTFRCYLNPVSHCVLGSGKLTVKSLSMSAVLVLPLIFGRRNIKEQDIKNTVSCIFLMETLKL